MATSGVNVSPLRRKIYGPPARAMLLAIHKKLRRTTLYANAVFIQVLRYSALLAGVAYGFTRQSSITAQTKSNHIDAEYKRKEGLVQQAKAEWARRTAPAEANAVITDPSSPNFDLETLMTKVADGSLQV
ncbi:F1F0 ATP synthase subunit e, mitochondrial [Lecanora helva]